MLFRSRRVFEKGNVARSNTLSSQSFLIKVVVLNDVLGEDFKNYPSLVRDGLSQSFLIKVVVLNINKKGEILERKKSQSFLIKVVVLNS